MKIKNAIFCYIKQTWNSSWSKEIIWKEIFLDYKGKCWTVLGKKNIRILMFLGLDFEAENIILCDLKWFVKWLIIFVKFLIQNLIYWR